MKRYILPVLICVCLGCFFLFAFLFDGMPGMGKLKSALQTDTVSTGILDYGAMGQLLKRLGVITFSDNDYSRYPQTSSGEDDLETMTFQKKRQVADYLYKVDRKEKEVFRSTEYALHHSAKKGWPIVSIAIGEDKLYDPKTGIVANSDKSGRDWERLAQVTYIEDGDIKVETRAGLRVHGGKRLMTRKYQPAFKLYFRKRYGQADIPGETFFPGLEVPLKTIVLQNSVWPPGYPMNNPLAYDVAREIDCVVPQTRLVEVLVNGKSMGMGFAVEHLSRRQWGQRFGHDNYNFHKFRSEIPLADLKMYQRKFWKLVGGEDELSSEVIGETIDLDNLSRHVFSWAFCGTTDYCQGVAVFDNEDPDARLYWINWDMDHSFYDLAAERNNLERENWTQSGFKIIYRNRHHCGRTKMFSRLMNESPEFKLFFIGLMTELMNHRLTEEFLQGRVDYYGSMMENFGQPHEAYVDMLHEFMEKRPALILAEAQEYFGLEGPYTLRLDNPDKRVMLVDGYSYSDMYEGKYYRSTPVHISLSPEDSARLRFWLVNGKRVIADSLDLELSEDTAVSFELAP